MKLLFCYHCNDIVKLFPERRFCKCGKSWGQYLEDNSTTVQTTDTLSIGLANPDFHRAIEALVADSSHFSPELSIRAWLNPFSEPDVKYVVQESESDPSQPEEESEC